MIATCYQNAIIAISNDRVDDFVRKRAKIPPGSRQSPRFLILGDARVTDLAAFSIFALTVGLSLGRPTVARLRIHHSTAALIGALLALVTGVVPLDLVLVAFEILMFPLITIVSLMVITLV